MGVKGMKTRPRAIHRPGVMNGAEQAYSLLLSRRREAGEISEYFFEPVKLKLGKACFYSPDFMVIRSDGRIEMHEVKGFWRDDARVKIKAAADKFPFVFIAATQTKTGWAMEIIQEGEPINEKA